MRTSALLLMLLIHACDRDEAAIVVSDSAPGPQIVFVNCKQPDRLLPLGRIKITRTSGMGDPYECKFEVTGHAGLVGAWRYGEPVPGYSMSGCSPFRPGDTYEVFATLNYSPTVARIRIEQDGRITMLGGGCN